MMRLILLVVLLLAACAPASTASEPPVSAADEPFYAPDFTLNTINGGELTLSDMRGRWVILNFWATWCVPCVEEMPTLQAIASERRDLALFGINMRETEEEVRDFLQMHRLNFPILINPDDDTLGNYQVIGLPQTVVIAPDGQLVWRQFGPLALETFRGTLDDLIAQFPA